MINNLLACLLFFKFSDQKKKNIIPRTFIYILDPLNETKFVKFFIHIKIVIHFV